MRKSNWDIAHIDMRTAPVKKEKEKGFFKWLKCNWKRILIVVAALYLMVISYGVLTTRFYENDAGEKVAYRMSFADLKKEDDYIDLYLIVFDKKEERKILFRLFPQIKDGGMFNQFQKYY